MKAKKERFLPPKGKKIIGWKKCQLMQKGYLVGWALVKLEIPADAERILAMYDLNPASFGSSSTYFTDYNFNRRLKCRASKAKVLEIQYFDHDETKLGRKPARARVCSAYDRDFTYVVGKTVIPTENFTSEDFACGPGIHFFLTKKQAKDYK